jgi:hypothetical protein
MFSGQRKRRWQFRLSTLFVVITLLAVIGAAYGNHKRRIARQIRAFEGIAERGGTVLHYTEGAYITFDPKGVGGICGTGLLNTYSPTTTTRVFDDNDLKLLEDIIKISSVDFKHTKVTPNGIARFRESHANCHVSN